MRWPESWTNDSQVATHQDRRRQSSLTTMATMVGLATMTSLATVAATTLSPGAALAADYIIDNNIPQTQADLPASANTGYVMVGDNNPNQSLTIEQSYSNALLIIGHTANSSGNTVRIKDLSTVYTNVAGSPTPVTGPAVLVGENSSGNTLEVLNGGQIKITAVDKSSSYDLQIGYNKGADNNTLRVSGAGSSLSVENSIYTGFAGANNTLEILGGASASAGQMRIGGGTGSATGNAGAVPSGNVVKVDGVGSSLTVQGTVNLGATGGVIGGSNRLEITNGASATIGIYTNSSLSIGYDNGSNNNQLLVSGSGSTLKAYNIDVGNGLNSGNSLKLGDGGAIYTGAISFNDNSLFDYGVGSNPGASVTAVAVVNIGSNVYVKPYVAPGASLQNRYRMLTLQSGSITGSFASLDTSNLPASLGASLVQASNSVDLELTARLGVGAGLTINQTNVAQGINNAFNQGAPLPPAFAQLFSSPSTSALGQQLSLLSGETATGVQQVALQSGSGFLSLISGPRTRPGSSTDDSTSGRKGRSLWVNGIGVYSSLQGQASTGSHDLTLQGGGAVLGVEQRINASTVIGAAIADLASSWSLDANLGGGSGNSLQLGLYAHHDLQAGYLSAAMAYGNHWMTTSRSVDAQTLTAAPWAWTLSGRLEAGYRISQKRSTLTPYAAITVQHYTAPTYGESGGDAALNVLANGFTDPTTELGLRWQTVLNQSTVFLRAAWLHDFNPESIATASFQNLASSAFSIYGAPRAADAALLSAGVDWNLSRNVALKMELGGAFSGQELSANGLAKLSYRW